MIESQAQIIRAYIDTDVLILAFESKGEEWAHLESFFEFASHRSVVTTSELTLAEVFAPSRLPRPDNRMIYENLLIKSGVIKLWPVTRSILLATADLRKAFHLKLPDAIHIETCRQAGCTFFISADRDGKKLPLGITHVHPDAASIHSLMEALRA